MAQNCLYNARNGILRKVWPLYRGKRAGKLVKSREAARRHTISFVHTREYIRGKETSTSRMLRAHNPENCVVIVPTQPSCANHVKKGTGKTFVPGILL